ncbi:MAG: CsgG/HfaB family protein [Candidatus Bipolaricaulota bacterium]|nr:CsgG/HfaB family protein [Candidatus Bipolaricaulota bacterium]
MRRLIPLIGLILVLLVVNFAFAKPDLVVTDISPSTLNPTAGEEVIITATVENVGTSDAVGRFNVRFLLDGEQIGIPVIPFGLKVNRSQTVEASWAAELGTHMIEVEADQPFDRIDETNETNNSGVATIQVPLPAAATAQLADLKVAVARFEDDSGSGFINVGEGVADELIERLVNSGVRVLERSELEKVLRERDLNPSVRGDLATAGGLLGADLLIVGAVTKVDVKQVSFSMGFLSLSSASVDVDMSARLVNVYSSEIERAYSAQGKEEGATGFSVDIGKIVSLSQPVSSNVCTGGMRADKPFYYTGETVHIGYSNPGWYRVDIYQGSTPVRWLGWQFVSPGGCGEWFWDQRDSTYMQVGPGTYIAKLWTGSSYVAAVSFQINPGSGQVMPLIGEITVGDTQFDETIVGKATNSALNKLVVRLIKGMEEVAPTVIAARGALPAEQAETTVSSEGQIARILSDGRIAINIGSDAGVSKGDSFQVLETENLVTDPGTGAILAYDVVGIKGELIIVEVREKASYAVVVPPTFTPFVGDIVVSSVP